MIDGRWNLHVSVIFTVVLKSIGDIFLFQRSFILSRAADTTEYLGGGGVAGLLSTSVGVRDLTSSGALTPRPSLHSYQNISKWVLTSSSKRS